MKHDFNSKTTTLDATLNMAVDEAQQEKRQHEAKRNYLGASYIGKECDRAIFYAALNTPIAEGMEPDGNALRRFDRGHWGESYMLDMLRRAGALISDIDPVRQKQWECRHVYRREPMGVECMGHLDGIMVDWRNPRYSLPLILPALWENKVLNTKNYAKMVREGVKKSKPVYFAQVQFYLGKMELEECLFTTVNADTMEVNYQSVPFDLVFYTDLLQRVDNLLLAINSKEAPPKGEDVDFMSPCKYCDFKCRGK